MTSIVIPAHNEESLIGDTLSTMLEGTEPGEMEIIVVCNGCRDATAEVARRFEPAVRVIETSVASKSDALNLGDEAASSFPRFFVDADIRLPADSIRKVGDTLRQGGVQAAAPMLRVDLANRPWTVRAFYDIWMRLAYVREGMLGCGVYALNEAGRRRFDRFPDIIADDHFVHLHFRPDERASVESASFLMRPPRRLRDLIQIEVRRLEGVLELEQCMAELGQQMSRDRRSQRMDLLRLVANPLRWPALAVYVYSKTMTTTLHFLRSRNNRHKEWSRDESSRQA